MLLDGCELDRNKCELALEPSTVDDNGTGGEDVGDVGDVTGTRLGLSR